MTNIEIEYFKEKKSPLYGIVLKVGHPGDAEELVDFFKAQAIADVNAELFDDALAELKAYDELSKYTAQWREDLKKEREEAQADDV